MASSVSALLLASFLLVCGSNNTTCANDPKPGAETKLTLTGIVLMPDGKPAAGATVESSNQDEPPIVAQADAGGCGAGGSFVH